MDIVEGKEIEGRKNVVQEMESGKDGQRNCLAEGIAAATRNPNNDNGDGYQENVGTRFPESVLEDVEMDCSANEVNEDRMSIYEDDSPTESELYNNRRTFESEFILDKGNMNDVITFRDPHPEDYFSMEDLEYIEIDYSNRSSLESDESSDEEVNFDEDFSDETRLFLDIFSGARTTPVEGLENGSDASRITRSTIEAALEKAEATVNAALKNIYEELYNNANTLGINGLLGPTVAVDAGSAEYKAVIDEPDAHDNRDFEESSMESVGSMAPDDPDYYNRDDAHKGKKQDSEQNNSTKEKNVKTAVAGIAFEENSEMSAENMHRNEIRQQHARNYGGVACLSMETESTELNGNSVSVVVSVSPNVISGEKRDNYNNGELKPRDGNSENSNTCGQISCIPFHAHTLLNRVQETEMSASIFQQVASMTQDLIFEVQNREDLDGALTWMSDIILLFCPESRKKTKKSCFLLSLPKPLMLNLKSKRIHKVGCRVPAMIRCMDEKIKNMNSGNVIKNVEAVLHPTE